MNGPKNKFIIFRHAIIIGGDDKQRGRVIFRAFPLDINGTRLNAFVMSCKEFFDISSYLPFGYMHRKSCSSF